jgi:phosphoglycolate phosphatase
LRDVFRVHYGFSASDAERIVVKFREYFSETGLLENDVYAGIRDLLKLLKDCGAVMAVATSKAAVYAIRIVKHFQLDGYFAFVSGDEMDGSLAKNGKGEIIRIALRQLDPQRDKATVMIGDRQHDIHGALDVGIDSIGITWGYGSRKELEEAGAMRIAASLDELCSMIME